MRQDNTDYILKTLRVIRQMTKILEEIKLPIKISTFNNGHSLSVEKH